jgi:hypothetical protein
MSPPDMPIQSLAHRTTLCSLAICSWLMLLTSPAPPNSPCPYSDSRPGVADVTERGMLQMKLALVTLPGVRTGSPFGPRRKREPAGQPGWSR